MRTLLIYVAAGIVTLWGIAHIMIPTRAIMDGFGPISADNRRILLMEWLMEGVLLIFLGVLVVLVTLFGEVSNNTTILVYRSCAVVLLVMAGISLFTGARTKMLPMKLCPPIFVSAATLFFLATVIWCRELSIIA